MMAFVALVALNFGAVRAAFEFRNLYGLPQILLLLGALPMVNVLAVGLMRLYRRLGSYAFLLGFEVFGATALLTFVAADYFFTDDVFEPYLDLFYKPFVKTFGRGLSAGRATILASAMVLMLGLPQLIFALIGGSLFRRFGVGGRPD